MPVAAFDTLKYVKQLKLAGVSDEQAEAQSAALAEALQTGIQNLVTTTEFRAESGSIRQEMRSGFEQVRQEMKAIEQRLDSKIDRLETRFEGQFVLMKWMLGVSLTISVGIFIRLFFWRAF